MSDASGQGNRFAPVTTDNHSGAIWITTILCLVYSTITITTRAWLRKGMYGMDDGLILLSYILQIGEAVATMLSLSRGLGQTLTLHSSLDAVYVSESAFSSVILYILCATFSKVSTLYLMMRLFNLHGRKTQTHHHDRQRLYLGACFAILVLMLMWGAASVVAVSVRCMTSTQIQPPSVSQCTSQYLRWQIITAFDIATEALLILNAILIVTPVKLGIYLKFQVVFAFALRLPLIALAVLRLHYVKSAQTAENPGTAQTPIMVLQQVYLCWAIISATLPNLKAFVRSFGSGFGIGIDMETYTNSYGSKKSYEMNKLSTTRKDGSGNGSGNRSVTLASSAGNGSDDKKDILPIQSNASQKGDFVRAHPLPHNSHSHAEQQQGEQRDVDSVESSGSEAQIIRKHVGWTVRYEDDAAAAALPRAV